MSRKETPVVMQFSQGEELLGWESLTITENFLDPIGSLNFTARPVRGEVAKYESLLAKGEPVGIKIGEVPQSAAIITTVTKKIDRGGSVTYSIEAKSPLAAAYEGHVDPHISKKFPDDVPIWEVVVEALEPYGFKTVEFDEAAHINAISGTSIIGKQAKIQSSEIKKQEMQAQNGEAAYAFCARLVTRAGVVLRTNWEGKLLLTSPDYEQASTYTLVTGLEVQDVGNRMLDVTVTDTNNGQFSDVTVRGVARNDKKRKFTTQPVGRVRSIGADEIKRIMTEDRGFTSADVDDFVYEPTETASYKDIEPASMESDRPLYLSRVQPYKPFFFLDKKARDKTECENTGKLLHSLRAANAFTVNCTVDGFIAREGAVWSIDTIARVVIGQFNFDEEMWILERTFSVSRGDAQKTQLKLVPKNAVVIGEPPRG